MAIVWPCPLSVDRYAASGREIEVPRPDCPQCGSAMTFWSGYWRHIRQGVARRHPRLGPDEVNEACDLYRSGKSLPDIGAVSSVDPGTVRRALTKVGVPMRDPHGRERA